MLTVIEAAKRLDIPEVTLRSWLKKKIVPGAIKHGSDQRGMWLIPEASLAKIIRPTMGRPMKEAKG
jgi:predicted site-specific integrase-resolvase